MATPLLLNIAILAFVCVIFAGVLASAIWFNSSMNRLEDSVDGLGDSIGELQVALDGIQSLTAEIHESNQQILDKIAEISGVPLVK